MDEIYKLLIGSQWRETELKDKIKNPYDGKIIGQMCIADKNDMEDAISFAVNAYKITRDLSRAARSSLLLKIAMIINNEKDDLGRTIALEAGKPISQALKEVDRAVSTFTIASEEAKRLCGELIPVDIETPLSGYSACTARFPIGPIAAISPFNFPLNLVAHKVAPAIASGNTIVHKPAHNTPITAVKLGRIIEKAGAVPGTYNVVQCKRPVSEMLATDDRLKMLTFTGSAPVGWHLKKLAFKKKVTLELGGNAGVVVGKDADLEWAALRCSHGAFSYSGQICISVQRIFAEDRIFDNFKELLLSETSKLKTGNPLNKETFVGPIIDNESAERIMNWIEEARSKGAKVLYGGERKDTIINPTILTNVDTDNKLSCEEAFGPVVILEKCSNFLEGVRRVNDSKFGLQAGIFTHDIREIESSFRIIDVGGLIVNDFPTFRVDNYPYGGIKESGFGREGVKYTIEEMTELKTIVLNFNR